MDTLTHTAHLVPLYTLNGAASAALIGAIGAWFVDHDDLPRERLVLLVAEAEAVAS